MIRIIGRVFSVAVVLTVCLCYAWAQEGKKYAIKTAANPVPKELSEPIRKLLADSSILLLDDAGKPICEIWLRRDMPSEATPEQVKTGVTYREVKQTEILGAIQFHRSWTDYRKQKIKAGVYTMRLGYQPADGKHTPDISEYQDFALVIAAKADTKPGLLDAKEMQEISGDSIGAGHPGIFMLWPASKPGKEPELTPRPKNHWVVTGRSNLVVAGKPAAAPFGIGITLVGHTPAE